MGKFTQLAKILGKEGVENMGKVFKVDDAGDVGRVVVKADDEAQSAAQLLSKQAPKVKKKTAAEQMLEQGAERITPVAGAAAIPASQIDEDDVNVRDTVMNALETVDSYTGSPTRTAIKAAQEAETISDIPGDAYDAFMSQLGQDPEQGASGEDIVENMNIDKDSVVGKMAALGYDVVLDPLNLIGGGIAAKTGAKALKNVNRFKNLFK